MKVCSACGKSKAKADFDKNQLEKEQSNRRCHECVTANKPPLRVHAVANTIVLPAGGGLSTVFCSQEIRDQISFTQDADGNTLLNLDALLGNPKDDCTNVGCSEINCKLICGQCKRVAYCSKQCQVSDWKRHKHVECDKKPKKLVLVDASSESLVEATVATRYKMYDYVERLVEAGETSLLPETWKLFNDGLHNQDEDVRSMQPFMMKYYQYFAGPAAHNIAKYQHLKGALFFFTKVSIKDLVGDDENLKNLDRCFAVVWGCGEEDVVAGGGGEGRQARPKYTTKMLSKKFPDKVTSLPLHMENCCDSKSFTVVICSNPSGSLMPDEFSSKIRPPSGVDMIDYIHETPEFFTAVGRARFFDFDAHVELGRHMPNCEVMALNMDRSPGDPVF